LSRSSASPCPQGGWSLGGNGITKQELGNEAEITDATLEAHAQTIFDEAENRLHAQKAVLSLIARK
jgi:ornithine carbamoyltransferase